MDKYLKITRKRSLYNYLCIIDRLSFKQGDNSIEIGSLRWQRIQLCIDSVMFHFLSFGVGLKI